MKFLSTRANSPAVDLPTALINGIAPDGGLYVPGELPILRPDDFDNCHAIDDVARVFLHSFFAGSVLAEKLTEICRETFSFPLPLVNLRSDSKKDAPRILELFHGPTAAFKDVGARFLASSLVRIPSLHASDKRPILILVATSGDTGGAVAAAFHKLPGFEVAVLFPKGRVSARQQHQLTCWGDNVQAFCVDGSFDDCQRLVKSAFADPALNSTLRLSSANSINIGRLLPQAVYYAYASLLHWRQNSEPLNFIIPTGNLGNGLAAVLARACGLPIGDIYFATNANRTIPDFLESGNYVARDSVTTLASAMDVGNPSNMERLRHLFGEADSLNSLVTAAACDDARIRKTIAAVEKTYDMAICPHTATAFALYEDLSDEDRKRSWALVATAHPAKFDDVVEAVISKEVPIPPALDALLQRRSEFQTIKPELTDLATALGQQQD